MFVPLAAGELSALSLAFAPAEASADASALGLGVVTAVGIIVTNAVALAVGIGEDVTLGVTSVLHEQPTMQSISTAAIIAANHCFFKGKPPVIK